jgi:hypothetical protein
VVEDGGLCVVHLNCLSGSGCRFLNGILTEDVC